MRFVRTFEGNIACINITLTIDEGRALLKQSRQTWLWKRFIEYMRNFL